MSLSTSERPKTQSTGPDYLKFLDLRKRTGSENTENHRTDINEYEIQSEIYMKTIKAIQDKNRLDKTMGYLPLLFKIVLDRVLEKWEKKLKEEKSWKSISLGTKKNNQRISYLACADDLIIMSDSSEMAIKQIKTLKQCAEKVDYKYCLKRQCLQ